MSDLISRSALKQDLRKHQIESLIAHTEEKNVFDVINEQPTAYDVEKVMDQLEENQTIKFHFTGEPPTQTIDYETAIDIVKRGGVE